MEKITSTTFEIAKIIETTNEFGNIEIEIVINLLRPLEAPYSEETLNKVLHFAIINTVFLDMNIDFTEAFITRI